MDFENTRAVADFVEDSTNYDAEGKSWLFKDNPCKYWIIHKYLLKLTK